MRGIFRQRKFSVIVWVKRTDDFDTIRDHLIKFAGDDPHESTEYEGMVDFHWGFDEYDKANSSVDSLREFSKRPEIVLLRLSSLEDDIESFSLKDERRTKH